MIILKFKTKGRTSFSPWYKFVQVKIEGDPEEVWELAKQIKYVFSQKEDWEEE